MVRTITQAIIWARKKYRAEPGVAPLEAPENPLEAEFVAQAIITELRGAGFWIGRIET